MMIARTKHPKYSYEGVEIHDITDWLLRRNQSWWRIIVMIRKMQNPDINRVADIWLKTNLKAHDFIPEQYWTSTSQFNLSGMDRYWLYRIYRSRCSAAAGSSCRKSYGYCQYGTVSLLWKRWQIHFRSRTQKVKKLEKQKRRLQRSLSRSYEKNKKGVSYCKTNNVIKKEKLLLKRNNRLTNIRKNYLKKEWNIEVYDFL